MPIFSKITRFQAHVSRPDRIAELTHRAFTIAMAEREGSSCSQFDSAVVAAEYAGKRQSARLAHYGFKGVVDAGRVYMQTLLDFRDQRMAAPGGDQYLEPHAPRRRKVRCDPVTFRLRDEK